MPPRQFGQLANSPAERFEIAYKGDRMLVMSATINLKTPQPDTVRDLVIDLAFKYKGYVLNSDGRVVSIRIPAAEFDKAVSDIESMGRVLQKNITGQDITDEYTDLQTRLDNAEKTRQRYLALLDKAAHVQEILLIEKELERLSRDIELLKGKIEKLSHSIQYCTITVKTMPDISPVRPGPIGYAFYYLYKGAKWLFVWD